MGSSILSIGQSALAAAQVGLATTGHNIANASTPGYSRQIVMQGAVAGQDGGVGFIGKGTEVVGIRRVYSEFLSNQVVSAQTSKGQLDSYYTQISRIDNLLADPSVGVSPALQNFFKDVQNVSANPNDAASRQSMLSSAQSLAASFQSLDGQMTEMRGGVNSEIGASITSINAYAKQIGQLNDSIEKIETSADGKTPNDLLDQRDQLIADLSKEVKVSVVKQNNSYNVFIGNGQPLVIGTKTYDLIQTTSPTDLSRMEVGYVSKGEMTVLAENALTGGRLGGLFEFRAKSLDAAQNALGRVALGLATTFNAQHKLGVTQSGVMGGDFFTAAAPIVTPSTANSGNGVLSAAVTDVGKLTISDYRVQYDGSNYNVTRLSDGAISTFATFPQTIDGVKFDLSGMPATSDSFLVRPTAAAAAGLRVAISDKADIAAAAPPVVAAATATNTGTAKISSGAVTPAFTSSPAPLPVSLSYSSGPNTLSVNPPMPVTVTSNGVSTNYAAGAAVTYTSGATISFGGVEVVISGAPANGDSFTVSSNPTGAGDSSNAVKLAALQTANTLDNNMSNYQGAYAQLVSMVGNKTRELEVTSAAAGKVYTQAVQEQQSESGVNLDEEAANLMRYQQAYQAAGKVMQTASQLFDMLLTMGN